MTSNPELLDVAPSWPVLGQARAVTMLRRSLASGQTAHAYLFTGPPGVGKHTLAIAFAMTLNCQAELSEGQLWPDAPCGLCSSCSRILRGSHPDVVEINLLSQGWQDAEAGAKVKTPPKEIRIDAIRELVAGVGLRPYSARWKVYIIGDAERLNEEASNSLLKTLEEPPDQTKIILLADDEASVLPTIASRCFVVPLQPMSRAQVVASLVKGWDVEPERAAALAALSGGRLGYATRLSQDRDSMARHRQAIEALALLSKAHPSERIAEATRLAKLFTDARSELFDLLDTWEGWWRDVLLVSAGSPEFASNIEQMTTLRSFAARVSVARANEAVMLVQGTRQQLMENVNPRLALEALTLGLP